MQIKSAKDLTVYKTAYELAMEVFAISKKLLCRGEILAYRPNPVLLSIGMW